MSLRTDRVASLIKEEVGAMITREYRSVGFITVTDVHMTPDLKIAKIFVSIFGTDKAKQDALNMLEEQKSHIRSFIGSHVRLKFTPAVQIYLDDTLDRVEKIDRLLRQTHQGNNEEKP
jgi:ribosome-binding factor A